MGKFAARYKQLVLIEGIDASRLFKGKSTSQGGSARVVNSTGVSTSNGCSRCDPVRGNLFINRQRHSHARPKTIEEVRVKASMYDAQQGSTSGVHIDMSTSIGTNG